MFSDKKTMGLVLVLTGAVITVAVAAAYIWKAISEAHYTVVALVAGLAVLVLGILIMYGVLDLSALTVKKTAPSKGSRRTASSRADRIDLGDSRLAKAMRYAAGRIDEKVAAGKMTDAQADAYMDRIMAFECKVGGDEDAAIIGFSQLLGAIARA